MSLVKRNIVANLAGNSWAAMLSLLLVPLYIRFMGIEAYGIVGLFATLQTLLSLLDLGLSTTVNRELARMSAEQPPRAEAMRDLVRTLEVVYWAVAALIGIGLVLLAPVLAAHWLRAEQLDQATVAGAFRIIGGVIALQWPTALYSGGLLGLQRHVRLNSVIASVGTLRAGGAVLVLWLYSPTIRAYFTWHMAIVGLQTLILRRALWRALPVAEARAQFRRAALVRVWRFAAGMSGIAVLSLILTQLDKVLLSRLLPLKLFGYYALAAAVAAVLYRIVSPVFTAVFPRLSELVASARHEELARTYHVSCQLISVLVLPAAILVALFSRELLFIWTGNPTTVESTWRVLSLIICGTGIHALMHVPYALQLAYGWTTLPLVVNSVSVAVLAPGIYLAARSYGVLGPPLIWVTLNLGYFFISIPIIHAKLLPTEKWRWYLDDVGKPLLGALAVSLVGRNLLAGLTSRLWSGVALGLVFSLSTLAAVALADAIRRIALGYLVRVPCPKVSPLEK